MKYPDMRWGIMEAVVNKLGGEKAVGKFLSNLLVVRPIWLKAERSIVINYDSLSLDEMVAAFEFFNCNISSEYFTIHGSGTRRITIAIFLFGVRMGSKLVIAQMEKVGYRPSRIEELCALGAENPGYRNRQIVALGSSWRNLGQLVPYLDVKCSAIALELKPFDEIWDCDCLFAAVPMS